MLLWFKKKCSLKPSTSISITLSEHIPHDCPKVSKSSLPLKPKRTSSQSPRAHGSTFSFQQLNSPPSSPPAFFSNHTTPYVEPLDLSPSHVTPPLNIHASSSSEKLSSPDEPITPISSRAPSTSSESACGVSCSTPLSSPPSPPLQGDMTYQSFYALFASPPSHLSISPSLHSITDPSKECSSTHCFSSSSSSLFSSAAFSRAGLEGHVPPLSPSFDSLLPLPPSSLSSSSSSSPKKSVSFHPVCPLIAFTAPDYDRSSNPDDLYQRLLHRRISGDEIVQVRQELLLLKRMSIPNSSIPPPLFGSCQSPILTTNPTSSATILLSQPKSTYENASFFSIDI